MVTRAPSFPSVLAEDIYLYTPQRKMTSARPNRNAITAFAITINVSSNFARGAESAACTIPPYPRKRSVGVEKDTSSRMKDDFFLFITKTERCPATTSTMESQARSENQLAVSAPQKRKTSTSKPLLTPMPKASQKDQ